MLKRVHIQNFKSLKDVTLDLQKVNLLIGPNNSGKTNFLKALEFFGESRNIVSHVADVEKLLFKHKNGVEVKIYLIFDPDLEHIETGEYNYLIYLCNINDKGITFKDVWLEKEKERFRSYTPKVSDFNYIEFKSRIGELYIYNPDPNKLVVPGPVGTGVELVNADTSNLIGFLDRMLGNKYRNRVFNRIEADLQKCLPEFDQVEIDDITPDEDWIRIHGEESRKFSFKRLGLSNSQQGITYWADELSEGTLYFLALLCIINQPNPPKLLLLEEPEKGIHPRRIREVMDFIFRLAEEKDVQIILTTHNEHVLDDFATRPESVFVFDKDEEGATYVRNLQKDIIEPTNKRNEELGLDPIDLTSNLSENWLYGLLGGVPEIS